MLKGSCINPKLLSALAHCGHGDKVLIADGNYPLASKTNGAELVYLGMMPGTPTVTQVLEAVQSVANIERGRHAAGNLRNLPGNAGRHGA